MRHFFYILPLVMLASGVEAAVDPGEKITKAFVKEAKKTEISDLLIYPAKVESKISASVLSEFEGVIVSMNRHLGDRVKKGEVLFRLRHTDPVFNFAPILVRAPVSGVISPAEVSEGSVIAKNQLLATITEPRELRIRIEIPASDLARLRPGTRGQFLDSQQKLEIPIQLEGVSPVVDSVSGTAPAIVKILGPARMLTAGLLGQVHFEVSKRKVFRVSENAIVYRDENTFLKIVKDNLVEEVPVALGNSVRGEIEILKGLKEGDLVIERSSRFVKNGEKVELTKVKPE
jgi:multidrug efflux pump subunit AcrA (membrane-fusion protein)